ncbi:hypothetical protein Xenpb_02494 [Xenorhabdus sp. PB62.4]|nr:hypothetical protein [Xenorhabdus sp. PB62.4]
MIDIHKDMVKKTANAMELTRYHCLLQTRIAVLNDDLKFRFEREYPGIKLSEETENYFTEVVAT